MDFLLSLNERFFENRDKFYANNISFFSNFVKEKGVCEDTLIPFLRGLRTENVVDSLDAYIKLNHITAVETAIRYMWALKEFLSFILYEGGINNTELLRELESPPLMESSYIFKMRKAISSHALREKKGAGALSSEEVYELLTKCNEILSLREQDSKVLEKQKHFNQYRSALLIKVILLTGAAYRTVRNINRTDLNVSFGYICINGYEIRLPKNLLVSFDRYLEITSHLSSEENLFIEFDGKHMSDKTSTLSGFIDSIIGRKDVVGVIKYTIIQMIEGGLNETTIKNMTGIEKTILDDCHRHVYDNEKETRHLDATIRSLATFDLL